MTTIPTTTQVLTAEGIADYGQNLRQLSAAELRRLFAFASSGKINATRVIKNLIWQAYTAIRPGQRPPIAGNLRSFWYTDIKPVLSRLGVPVEGRRATELVYDAFVELVTQHGLFHYRDLGFLDEGAQTRAGGVAPKNSTRRVFSRAPCHPLLARLFRPAPPPERAARAGAAAVPPAPQR